MHLDVVCIRTLFVSGCMYNRMLCSGYCVLECFVPWDVVCVGMFCVLVFEYIGMRCAS